jgi:hypothetical protein
MASRSSSSEISTTRRRLLAAGGSAVVTAAAGCSAIGELVGELTLEEVNIFNETDQQISGAIEIIGPNGDAVLEETFDLVPPEDSEAGDDTKNSGTTYDDVWTDAGEYGVSIELTNTNIEDTTNAEGVVDIADTGAEMLGVTLGPEGRDEAILLRAGEDPADISDPADVSTEGN